MNNPSILHCNGVEQGQTMLEMCLETVRRLSDGRVALLPAEVNRVTVKSAQLDRGGAAP
jgi:hypothetical protein